MVDTQPLVPEPERIPLELSDHYAQAMWNHHPDLNKVTYKPYSVKRIQWCDECQWWKHEMRGKTPPYRGVRIRRELKPHGKTSTKDFIRLDLCTEHARLWKERDAQIL